MMGTSQLIQLNKLKAENKKFRKALERIKAEYESSNASGYQMESYFEGTYNIARKALEQK